MTLTFSPEQQATFDAVKAGRSSLCTGNAGTGKSVLLNAIREEMPVAVTASTGIAALNVGGATIHSFTGLGIGKYPVDKIISNMLRAEEQYNDKTYDKLRKLRALAIDEISMLEGTYFELVDELFRKIKGSEEPFGGVQVIMFGDFLQLPPINKTGIARFPFETEVWRNLAPDVHMLRKTFRQEDQEFADILNDIRMGTLTPKGVAMLNERFTAVDPDPSKPGIILGTHNDGCDHKNLIELRKLEARGEKVWSYKAQDTGKHHTFIEQLDRNCIAPTLLNVCVGARVMLLKNIDTYGGLANGSLGTVIKCIEGEIHVMFDNGRSVDLRKNTWKLSNGEELLAERAQIPLRLAWAVTVHKSQGMSLAKLEAHLDKCFAQSQAYVALSRARTREGLFLRGTKSIKISVNPKAVQFYKQYT